MQGLETAPFQAIVVSTGREVHLSFPVMTISFHRPDHGFWANATSNELYRLDLQELFTHLFCANQRTTEAFLEWIPGSYHAGLDLCEQASYKLAMLKAPIRYSNEDSDRRQDVSAWAMASVPVAIWVEWRNVLASQRWDAEKLAAV